MNGRFLSSIAIGLIAASWAWTQAPGPQNTSASKASPSNAADQLVLQVASNQWFEGPLERVTVSANGKWAIINRRGVQPTIQLLSLLTGREDSLKLMADLNRVDNAVFCGPGGALARLGERTVEDGWFLPHGDTEKLSQLPADASPVCAADETELAYYRANAADREVFIDVRGRVRDYGISGRITGMAFSPDGNYLYGLLFLSSGESSLVRIDANTGASKVVASHLDASPLPEHISISADGRKMYLALAGDGAPKNEARHRPEADRWLKIYQLDLTTAAQHRIVDTPGADDTAPTVAGNDLYWIRTVYQPTVVLVPASGGEAKEVIADGQLPMWSPDSKRIGYFFGAWRQADWGLDLDDAVIAVDDQGNRSSQPSVIVSGYGEDFPPAWSPDGKWIAFHSHRSHKPVPQYGDPAGTDDVYLRRADDVHAPEIRLTDFGWETGPAYWSPDGTKLLFSSWERNGQPGIDKLWQLTIDPDTGRLLRTEKFPLPADIRSASWAAWSPDGEEIAIEDNRGAQDRMLWVIQADGSHAQKVLDYKGTTYDGIDWLTEGKTIVYSALINGQLQLFAVPSLGGVSHQLTRDSGNLMHPKVSPDGRWIACTRIVQSKQIWRRKIN